VYSHYVRGKSGTVERSDAVILRSEATKDLLPA
jgi:hypothetical protein